MHRYCHTACSRKYWRIKKFGECGIAVRRLHSHSETAAKGGAPKMGNGALEKWDAARPAKAMELQNFSFLELHL
jgi:hypothetical protein